jgi:fumarate hydratase class II
MDKPFEQLDTDTLRTELELARERLTDVEETFNFTLANTNTHLADAMVLEFEQELYEHRETVAKLESLLQKKPFK